MKILNIVFFTFLFVGNNYSQVVLYEDYFHGGVSGTGMLIGINGYSPDTLIDFLELHIEEESTIRKAYLISNYKYLPPNDTIKINNHSIPLSPFLNEELSYNGMNSSGSIIYDFYSDIIDITDQITINDTTITLITPSFIPFNNNPAYNGFYFIVLYENQNMDIVNFTFIQNDKDNGYLVEYNIENLNPINIDLEIGMTINSSWCVNTIYDGCEIFINDIYTGVIGDDDPLSLPDVGSIGNFYHQNNTFFGLSDDTPDNVFQDTDAIANIQEYMNSNTSLNIKYKYQDTLNATTQYSQFTNNIWQTFLTYSTPCDTFSASVSDNQEICLGETVQLSTEGGVSYEWLPQEGLSCYDCPNPVFNDTTSHWYTVKVNNNDSCHKILPVSVRVSPYPEVPIFTVEPSSCSSNSGQVLLENPVENTTYQLNEYILEEDSVFQEIPSGNYTLQTTSYYGCIVDTTLYIPEDGPTTQALFTATHTQGEIPLKVQFNNQSTDATHYTWYIADDTLSETSPNYVFNEIGEFTASLIAYDTYPWCSDTSEVLTIITEYPFNIIIPSTYFSYTDSYQIYTSRVSELDYTLFNSIGQQVYHRHFVPDTGYSPLWERSDVARGVYLYTVKVTGEDGEVKELVGRVLVM